MKKVLLIITLTLCIFQMVVLAAVINIGSEAIDRPSSYSSDITFVERNSAADGTGTITSIKIYASSGMTGAKVAIFYVESGNILSTRDWETIQIGGEAPGVVPAGSQKTATVNLDVLTGDFIGVWYDTGAIEKTDGAATGVWYTTSNDIPADNVTFIPLADKTLSISGTGTTEVAAEDNAIFFGTNF